MCLSHDDFEAIAPLENTPVSAFLIFFPSYFFFFSDVGTVYCGRTGVYLVLCSLMTSFVAHMEIMAYAPAFGTAVVCTPGDIYGCQAWLSTDQSVKSILGRGLFNNKLE